MSITENMLFVTALVIVYVGEKIQQIVLTRVLSNALSQAQAQLLALTGRAPALPSPAPQAPQQPAPPVVPLPSPPALPLPVPAARPPAATGEYAIFPAWFQLALHEIGFHETGNNQGIGKYIAMAHAGSEGDPWCAIFSCAMLEGSGYRSPRSASSQSFRTDPNFVELSGPAPGAIVVYWRISKSSGQGHVGFYRGENATSVWTLGGNENDMVQIEALPKDSSSFGLIGYWWPKSAPLPTGGVISMPAGAAVSVKVDPTGGSPVPQQQSGGNKQTSIVATVFGSNETHNRNTAYGTALDDNSLGVALPYHFNGVRPMVNVTNRSNGKSVVCQVVDVGPWNDVPGDPYWQTGTRPEAETGVDQRGRKTNKAGIDLTIAAAQAISIDGKGLVDWEFVQVPSSPSVT